MLSDFFLKKYIGTRNKYIEQPLKIKVKSVDKNFGKACQYLFFLNSNTVKVYQLPSPSSQEESARFFF